MKVELLEEYLRLCKQLEALPTWKGLTKFKRVFKSEKGTW